MLWQPPNVANGILEEYRLTYFWDNSTVEASAFSGIIPFKTVVHLNASTLYYIIGRLETNTLYSGWVEGSTTAGVGAMSESFSSRTVAPAQAQLQHMPRNVSINAINSTSLLVTWTSPMSGIEVKSYDVQATRYRHESSVVQAGRNETRLILHPVVSNSLYLVVVTTTYEEGKRFSTDPICVQTPQGRKYSTYVCPHSFLYIEVALYISVYLRGVCTYVYLCYVNCRTVSSSTRFCCESTKFDGSFVGVAVSVSLFYQRYFDAVYCQVFFF